VPASARWPRYDAGLEPPDTTVHYSSPGLYKAMFKTDGVERPASYVAKQIHTIWVAENFFRPEALHLPTSKRDLFIQKIYVFCEASVLRVLLTELQNNGAYEELLQEFERLVFPSSPSPAAVAKLAAAKSAMVELDKLFGEQRQLSWCRDWFRAIGHDETNPEALATFARLLAEHTNSLRRLIHDLGPPCSGPPAGRLKAFWRALRHGVSSTPRADSPG
jgi:hypothetical protein